MTRAVVAAAGFAGLALLGCEPPLEPCVEQDGDDLQLWVDCAERQAGELSTLTVVDNEATEEQGERVLSWRIAAGRRDRRDFFYVVYGRRPKGWDELVEPEPLIVGRSYDVEMFFWDFPETTYTFEMPEPVSEPE